MFYGVTIIDDADLPVGHHFAVVQQGSQIRAYIKAGHSSDPAVLDDCETAAWRLKLSSIGPVALAMGA